MEYLLKQIKDKRIRIITPENPDERGCQLSIQVVGANKKLFTMLSENGVIADWREPDVIRVAPIPLYNSYRDVYDFVELTKKCLTAI